MNTFMPIDVQNQIKELYILGLSAQEIKDLLLPAYSVRQVQRLIKSANLTRNPTDAFNNAIKRGRMTYRTNPNGRKKRKTVQAKMRLQVLTRDGFKCVYCGATSSTSRLQVDHINNDPTDNRLENLQTLCEECNKGKAWLNTK